jgi:hypothetical protein
MKAEKEGLMADRINVSLNNRRVRFLTLLRK